MPDILLKVATDHQGQTESLVQESSPSKFDDQVTGRQGFHRFKCLGDTEHRNKLVQSWLIVWAFFSLGLTAGLNGSTLLDLQIITGTDLESASAFFTGFTSGYMAGSLFSGVVFNKINTRLLLFAALSGMGVVSIISPYCSLYPLMIFIRSFCGFFAGIIDTSGNAWHMKMWGSEGKVLMQIIHFFFALGGVLSPLYTEPFLAKRFMANGTATDNFTTGNTSQFYLANDPRTTKVQYAFLLSGVFMIITSIPFIVLFIKPSSHNIENHLEQNINIRITYRELPCCLHLFILTILCIIFLLYCCVELTFASFLMPFLINEYDSMTKAESVYIITVYWVSFATSRFLMIFVSKLLSTVRLLFLCLFFMIVAYTGFMVSALFEVIPAVVVFTAMTGFGMSGVFAGGFSWAEGELVKVTARVSSSITITASTAGNAWHMKIWGSEGKVLLQIIHFFFALGGVLSPLYTEPFLAKRFMANGTATDNFTTGNTSQFYLANDPRTTNVQYAFLLSGVFMIITSIPFIVLLIKPSSQNIENHLEQNRNIRITYRELPCCLHLFIQTILCIIYFLYGCIGLAFVSFLMSFLINEYDSMTKAESVYITTVFWVSFATSRFLMIFVSKLLSNVRLLFLCLFLMVTAFTGFTVSAMFEVIPAVVVFTAMTGLGMSGIFAGGVSWSETELLKVTVRVSSSITIAMSTGKIVIPLILGFLMEEASNMWFCYILLGQTVLLCLLYMFLLLYNRLYINMVYGPMMTLVKRNIPVIGTEMSLNGEKHEYETKESLS